MPDPQNEPIAQAKLHWYRIPLDRAVLAELNQRSDAWGFAQTLGHLGIISATGALSWYVSQHWSWFVLAGCLFLHGTVYAFLLNAFHELCHNTVFKTRSLNRFFLYLVSFLGGLNHIYFWASHQEHHKYTLHQPDDMEVILPVEITLKGFLTTAFINPLGLFARCKSWILLSSGRLENDWQRLLFPEHKPTWRRELFTWARILLVGHTLIVVQTLFTGWWMLPMLITLAPFYGGVLLFLCNNTQHVGLRDEVEDFRLCTRTIYLNPIVQFLYWHMNYHIEHHMYAGVPCYKLARLHRAIKQELPYTANGLYETWSIIIGILGILRRQKRLADHLVSGSVVVAPFMTLWKADDPLSGEWEQTAVRTEDGATFRRVSRSWHEAGSDIEHTEDHYRLLINDQVIAEEVHQRSPATRSYTQAQAYSVFESIGFNPSRCIVNSRLSQ